VDGDDPDDTVLSPELVALQRSLLALIASARAALDAMEAVVAEPRTFATGAAFAQQAAALVVPLASSVAASLLTPRASS
jgi:hypothetical protein